jgi:hypothetical protein
MNMPVPSTERINPDTLTQLETLNEALIDASSILYMKHVGFLDILKRIIRLKTTSEVLSETGVRVTDMEVIDCRANSSSNDQKLIQCARAYSLAVISEDKKILETLQREGFLFFNSLMMLNLLLVRHAVSVRQYDAFLAKLRDIAWYSEEVWEYGAEVRSKIGAGLSIPSKE